MRNRAPEGRPSWPPTDFSSFRYLFHPLADEIVVSFEPRQGGRFRRAFRGVQDDLLRFGSHAAVLVHPDEGVVVLRRAHIHDDSFRGACGRLVRLGGIDDGRKFGDGFLQLGVGGDGVLPDLIGVGGQVHLRVRIAVQNARLLGEEVAHPLIVSVILEEGLVRADDFGVLL